MSNPPPSSSPSTTSSFRITDRILQTVHEMFADRKYKVIPKMQWSRKNQQFEDLKVVAKTPHGQVLVFFATDPKVSVKKIREYISHMDEQKITHAILIYGHLITPGAKAGISVQYDFEMFQAKELFENKTRHLLVPKHELIEDRKELENVLKKFHVSTKTQLPKYDPEDMVVKYYHWPLGSVVKIDRRLGNQKEKEEYYRHVRI
jgi:DNA-directed RNA polymerase subunit H (RpoH/RPB5)